MKPGIEVRLKDGMTEEEWRRLVGWSDDPFRIASYRYVWEPKRWRILVCVEGEPVSHVGVTPQRMVKVGEEPVLVGGIGGVVTLPQYRGQGFARLALREAMRFLRDELGVDFGLLLCREELVPFYAAQGWKRVPPPVLIEQPRGKVPLGLEAMALALREKPWPPGALDLCGLPF
ncbi:MAG: GNAT family N-acetyltransferase [Bacillota bacterium]|nr:GNAT family N-acetyltransferase [Bacillota bacterium]